MVTLSGWNSFSFILVDSDLDIISVKNKKQLRNKLWETLSGGQAADENIIFWR